MQATAHLLWSINERLAGGDGADLPPLSLDWLGETVEIDRELAESRDLYGQDEAEEFRYD